MELDKQPYSGVLHCANGGQGGWSQLGIVPHGSKNGNLTKPPIYCPVAKSVRHRILIPASHWFESSLGIQSGMIAQLGRALWCEGISH